MYRRTGAGTVNTKEKIWRTLIQIAFGVLVLSACGKQSDEAIQQKSFGIDLIQEQAVESPEQIVCGQDGAWAITAQKNAPIYYLACENRTVGVETIDWQQEEGESLLNIAERDGTLYAEILSADRSSIAIRKYAAGGWWNSVMDIAAADDRWGCVGSGLSVDDSENVYLVSGNTVTRFGQGGEKICAYELKGGSCFLQGQNGKYMECVTVNGRKIVLYELREKEAAEKWTLDIPARCAYGIACGEEGTLCLATGESAAKNLFCGLLSERDAAAARRMELVYGTMGSLNREAAVSMQAAIRDFNRENENYYITIRNYYRDAYDGTFAQRLHTDMASGNAPDIMEMDSLLMYYESYVRNGYLEDLSPYLEQSKYREDILWNILNAYEMDGGLYLLAPHINLETLQVNPEYGIDGEEWNMGTFLELIERNRWEKDILLAGTPQDLLYYLVAGQQNRFIDWENRTAAFETEEFYQLLVLCVEYAARDWPDADGATYEELCRDSLCAADLFTSYRDYLVNVNLYGREYPLYGYPTSSGQAYKIGTCSDGCAIYAGSENKEGAWEFLESLLGETHQKWQRAHDFGFPIRRTVLAELRADGAELMVDREKKTMTENEFQIVDNVLQSGTFTRTVMGRDIWVIIEEESAFCFAGDKSVEEVAHTIQSRVEMLLSE